MGENSIELRSLRILSLVPTELEHQCSSPNLAPKVIFSQQKEDQSSWMNKLHFDTYEDYLDRELNS